MGIRLLQLGLDSRYRLDAQTGIKIPRFQHLYFDFARVEVEKENDEDNVVISTASQYKIRDLDDEFKIITLSMPKEDVQEDQIMFIVKYAFNIFFSENVEKIAGRDDKAEGIFLLKEGDSITIRTAYENATFTAARVSNKLYLVKEYPEYL